jgi:GTPase
MFVDRVEIEVHGGDGGDGCVSFRREKYVPRGGPNGGDGGHGGSVIITAVLGANSLVGLTQKKRWEAEKGTAGSGSNRHGKNGQDIRLEVPVGTLVVDSVNGFVVKDLDTENEQVIAAQGGRGGKGNTRFKSSTNQAPRQFTKGDPGEKRKLILELKVIADVGLIGLPNAGKSTLLSRMTQARPEIANYPFTTKYPNLGMVQVDYEHTFVMADIPGLIEGAHAGVGLGHDFLKHIERSGILVHLIEPTPMDGSDPLRNYEIIREELAQYDARLVDREEIVAITKSELPGASELRDELARRTGREVLLISAVTGQNLNLLTRAIVNSLEKSRVGTARA